MGIKNEDRLSVERPQLSPERLQAMQVGSLMSMKKEEHL